MAGSNPEEDFRRLRRSKRLAGERPEDGGQVKPPPPKRRRHGTVVATNTVDAAAPVNAAQAGQPTASRQQHREPTPEPVVPESPRAAAARAGGSSSTADVDTPAAVEWDSKLAKLEAMVAALQRSQAEINSRLEAYSSRASGAAMTPSGFGDRGEAGPSNLAARGPARSLRQDPQDELGERSTFPGRADDSERIVRGRSPIRIKSRYNYVPMKKTDQTEVIDYRELYRKGLRKSQADNKYHFMPGTLLDDVEAYIDAEHHFSRSPSPERPAQYISGPDSPVYFLIPLAHSAEALARGAVKIKVGDSDFPAKDKMQHLLFVFKLSNPQQDLNWFGKYSVVDVEEGFVKYGINSNEKDKFDMYQTSKQLQGQVPAPSVPDPNGEDNDRSGMHRASSRSRGRFPATSVR